MTKTVTTKFELQVSVPIRGLFNLTVMEAGAKRVSVTSRFRPHQGII